MTPSYASGDGRVELYRGDCREVLKALPAESVHCVVTSPPYWGLRNYGVDGQMGLEQTPEAYVAGMVEVFREVRRTLRPDGVMFLNLGDAYWTDGKRGSDGVNEWSEAKRSNGMYAELPASNTMLPLKPKDLIGIPWRVALALQADGWWLRSDIIWAKPNPMPESVTDRPTKAHEYLFLLAKSERYYYDAEAIAEPTAPEAWHNSDFRRERNAEIHPTIGTGERNSRGPTRNKRDVWTVATHSFSEAHFAAFPPDLIRPCILAGCPQGGVVLDPFNGAGTTGLVALEYGRRYIGIELNPEYIEMTKRRLEPALNLPPCLDFGGQAKQGE